MHFPASRGLNLLYWPDHALIVGRHPGCRLYFDAMNPDICLFTLVMRAFCRDLDTGILSSIGEGLAGSPSASGKGTSCPIKLLLVLPPIRKAENQPPPCTHKPPRYPKELPADSIGYLLPAHRLLLSRF